MAKTVKHLPPHMREPILDVVRHSVEDIDALLLKLQDRLQKSFVVGDAVNFKADSKVIKGQITAVHDRPTPLKINISSADSGSPSSDKENDFVSSDKSRTNNLKYSVKVNEKTVCSIPPCALSRIDALPSREAIRKFVLSKASYVAKSSTSAGRWNVKSLAKKRTLLSPTEPSKKSKTSKGKPVQKNTLDSFVKITRMSKDEMSNRTPTKASSPNKKLAQTPTSSKRNRTPNRSPARNTDSTSPRTTMKKTVVDIADADVEGSLSKQKKHNSIQTASPVTRKRTPSKDTAVTGHKQNSTPTSSKKRKTLASSPATKGGSESSAVQVVIVDLSKPDIPSIQARKESSVTASVREKSQTTVAANTSVAAVSSSSIPIIVQRTTTDSRGKPVVLKEHGHLVATTGVQDASKKPVSLLKTGSVVLKQLTLFELAKVSSSNAADGFASVTPPTPRIVRRYRKAMRENDEIKKRKCILLAAKEMTEYQRSLLPDPMKVLVQEKMEFLRLKEMMKGMTEDEKKILRQERRQEGRQERRQEKEDLLLDNSKPLPAATQIVLPKEIPASSLQDLIFVNQFLTSFRYYLTKPQGFKYDQLSFASLPSHLSAGDDVILEIMMSLLHTLLNDFTLSEAQEIGIPLKDIPINKNTLFSLLYLTFKMTSEKSERSDIEKAELRKMAAAVQTYTRERMPPLTQLECIKTLCTLLLDGKGMVDYQEDAQKKLTLCWKRKNEFLKTYAEFATKHGLEPPADANVVDGSGTSTPLMGEEAAQPQSLTDVLKLRREMSKRYAEDREKKQAEQKKQQEIAKDKAYLENQKLIHDDNVKAAMLVSGMSKRLTPLGLDRQYNRYWQLPGHQGVYVERGWSTELPSSQVDATALADVEPFVVPESQPYGWSHYTDKAAVDELMQSLNQQGMREKHLWLMLKKHYELIIAPSNNKEVEKKSEDKLQPLLESFREELLDLEDRIRSAGLGGIADYETWSDGLEVAVTIDELGKHLMTCQAAVYRNRRSGIMAEAKTGTADKPPQPVDGDADVEVNGGIVQWMNAVSNAQTLSSLFTLLEILDMCIAWEKSIDNTNCRVCKRKGDEATLLLCDGCDRGFHMRCLRIRLQDVPEGDWFCPSCAPKEDRKGRNSRNLKDLSDSGESESEQEEEEEESSDEEEEEECILCNEGGDVALCDTCLLGYHLTCHQPPLRAIPRFAWTCHACRFGTKMKKKDKKPESSIDTASQSSDNGVFDRRSSRQRQEVETKKAPAKKNEPSAEHSRPGRGQAKKAVCKDSESDSEHETARGSGRTTQSGRRRARVAKEPESDSDSEPAVQRTSATRAAKPGGLAEPESDSGSEPAVQMTRAAKRGAKPRGKQESEPEAESDAPPVKVTTARSSRRSRTETSNEPKPVVESKTKVNSKEKTQKDDKRSKRSSKDKDDARKVTRQQEEAAETCSPPTKSRRSRSTSQKDKCQLTLLDCVQQPEASEDPRKQFKQNIKTIHSKLWSHKSSWPFEYPIDAQEVPDYYNVVSTPMDLTTILEKMESYLTAEEFVEDMRQMIYNSFDYNKKTSEIAKLSVTFEDYFVKMLNKYLPAVKYHKQQILFGL